MKRSIRLNERLLQDAELEGREKKRSIASQVEYWAGIGQTVERERNQPTTEDLKKLSEFNSEFLAQVEKGVSSGRFQKELMKTGFGYEKSKLGPGFADKVFPDGTRITGKIVNGEFRELNPLSKNA